MYSEAKWTKPHDECLKPYWWHAPDGESTEIEVSTLVAALARALQPELVVETGTAYGQTAKLIGEALLANGHGELVTLDIDESRVLDARVLCRGLPVEVLCKSSLSYHPTQPIDFIWIDSDFHVRIQEFWHFDHYFHDQTIIGFHDTGKHKGDLGAQVSELPLDVLHLPTPRGACFARRKRAA